MGVHDPALSKSGDTSQASVNVLDSLRKLSKNFFLRKFLQAVLTILAVSTLIFFLIRLMPGNPLEIMTEQIIQAENIPRDVAYARAAATLNFDPDASVIDQYFEWLGNLLRFDFGTSITSPGTRVIDEIARFLPWTLFAVGAGLVISFTLGSFLGMVMAYYRNSIIDHVLSIIASALTGVPNYIWGLIIIIVFGIHLRWFSVGDIRGTYSPSLTAGFNLPFILDILKRAALPVFIYVISTLGTWMLSMKSSTMSVQGEDYVNVARARGLSSRRIMTAYVGRNAMLPLFTQLTISIGFVLGSGVVIEEIFVYWGLGHYLFASITTRDYTSMQGVFFILTASVVFANFFADMLYGQLDPRVRITGDD